MKAKLLLKIIYPSDRLDPFSGASNTAKSIVLQYNSTILFEHDGWNTEVLTLTDTCFSQF